MLCGIFPGSSIAPKPARSNPNRQKPRRVSCLLQKWDRQIRCGFVKARIMRHGGGEADGTRAWIFSPSKHCGFLESQKPRHSVDNVPQPVRRKAAAFLEWNRLSRHPNHSEDISWKPPCLRAATENGCDRALRIQGIGTLATVLNTEHLRCRETKNLPRAVIATFRS